LQYSKPPLSVDEQIALLRRRGMVFADEARARHALAHINYYRLRAYWLPFEVQAGSAGEHRFAPETRFESG
jgi:abortive infection bacteriophage resistance protein